MVLGTVRMGPSLEDLPLGRSAWRPKGWSLGLRVTSLQTIWIHLGETIRLFNLFHEDWIGWWLWRPLSVFWSFPYVLTHLYSIYRKVERWVHHIHHAQSGSTCFNHDPAAAFALAGRGGVGG